MASSGLREVGKHLYMCALQFRSVHSHTDTHTYMQALHQKCLLLPNVLVIRTFDTQTQNKDVCTLKQKKNTNMQYERTLVLDVVIVKFQRQEQTKGIPLLAVTHTLLPGINTKS